VSIVNKKIDIKCSCSEVINAAGTICNVTHDYAAALCKTTAYEKMSNKNYSVFSLVI